MRLLERDAPLAILDRLLAEAATESGRLVFVEGEAGIGKTSLLTQFRDQVPTGTRVLLGSCDPLSTPRPLGPFVDIADGLGGEFAGLIRDGASRDEVLRGLIDTLRRTSAGLVVLLEDLHWADEATLDALRFIGRRIQTTRSLVVGTYRDDEVGRQHPLRVVVGDLATSPAVRRLPLGALSATSVEELARGSDIDPAELHRLTGGNPFFVTEVLAGAPERIPPTLRDAVLARAARLAPPARRTLEAAAVIGYTVEPWLLARVTDGPPAADECLSSGVLKADEDRYTFRHEIGRRAILDSIDPATRIALNATVLAALEAAPDAEPARLAHHAEEAGDRDAILRHAPEAGRRASAVGSHREAAAQLDRAVRFADALAPAERAPLLESYAREHQAVGRYDVANEAWAEAVAIWRAAGERRREGAALAQMGLSLVVSGRNAEGEAASREALEVLDPIENGPEKVQAMAAQAFIRMLDRDNVEAVELGRLAIALGESEPAAIAAVVQAWNTVGSARILLGDDEGRAELEESLRLAREHGLDRGMASAYANLASAFAEMYRFDDADPYFEQGIRHAIERDLDSNRGYLEAWQALSMVHRGRWSEAGALASSLLAGPNTSVIRRIMTLVAVGRLRSRRGDPDAGPALDEALDLAERTGTLQRLGPVAAARAEAAWLAGDRDRIVREVGGVFDLASRHAHPWHVGELAWWLSRAGAPPADTSAAAQPWALQLEGRPREAAEAWRALGCPYEAARALLDADDVDSVRAAHAIFDELGARPAAAMAALRLRELGAQSIPRGRRATTRANPAGLTAREVEILRYVAGGMQNHEIAARLYLSPRTVDHHVSAVLGKLGVARRSELAAAAAKAGIDP